MRLVIEVDLSLEQIRLMKEQGLEQVFDGAMGDGVDEVFKPLTIRLRPLALLLWKAGRVAIMKRSHGSPVFEKLSLKEARLEAGLSPNAAVYPPKWVRGEQGE